MMDTLATIPVPEGVDVSDFILEISSVNEGVRIEQETPGYLTLMPAQGFDTSDQNGEILVQLSAWNKQGKRGRCPDSTTLFILPSGKMIGPDAAWISHSRLEGLTRAQLKKFIPRVPEFIIELMSPSDRKPKARLKMTWWIEGGAELAWLIDPSDRSVEIYRPGQAVEVVRDLSQLAADGPVVGFVLDLDEVWNV